MRLVGDTDEDVACRISPQKAKYSRENVSHKMILTLIFNNSNKKIYNRVDVQYNHKTKTVALSCLGLKIGEHVIHPSTNKKLKCKMGRATQHALDTSESARIRSSEYYLKKRQFTTKKKCKRSDIISFVESFERGVVFYEYIRYNPRTGNPIYSAHLAGSNGKKLLYIDIN